MSVINLDPMNNERDSVSFINKVIEIRVKTWNYDFMSSKYVSLKMRENPEQFELMVKNCIKDTEERYKFEYDEKWNRIIHYTPKRVLWYFQ